MGASNVIFRIWAAFLFESEKLGRLATFWSVAAALFSRWGLSCLFIIYINK